MSTKVTLTPFVCTGLYPPCSLRVGVSGTRFGMTESQRKLFIQLIDRFNIEEFHHGDCIGVDAETHGVVSMLDGPRIVIHPPISDKQRAFCASPETLPAKDYLARNKDIVNESQVIIIIPAEDTRQMRGSGTWSTYRYAIKECKSVFLIGHTGVIHHVSKPKTRGSK